MSFPLAGGCANNTLSVMVLSASPKAVTYTVILVAGQQTQPLRIIEADTTEEAWERARELFPATDLALVANED